MRKYILKRLIASFICLIGISLIVFIAVRLSGDVTQLLLPEDAKKEDFVKLRAELGLDKPLPVQYLIFVKEAVKGNFGQSTRFTRPAMELVLGRLPATLQLASMAFFIAVVLGVLFGVTSAQKRGSLIDFLVRIGALIGQSMPNFWLGLMFILVISVQFELLPTSGRGGISHMILPAVTLSLFSIAAISRLSRSAMLNVLGSDYIKMARLKGCSEKRVIWKHALKNAAIPVITLAGLQLAQVIGYGVIVETVFAWPGLGKLIVDAVFSRDYAVVQAGVTLLSVIYIIINMGVDLLYGVLDPQIRYE
ncbi:MAG TPA: ABC transporter permease [Syntrophorhabdaceae bacterium]|nr:ABC transporter permease [Syntrophorhabdaceae bacterium]